MQIRLFNIPITDTGELLNEMNCFLAGNKVLEVEQRFFNNEKGAYWCFCIRYLNNTGAASFNKSASNNKEKTDYKLVLSEQEFFVFSKLRECRKIIAAADAVPAYAVFTDEELAGIARLPLLEVPKLISVKGIGDKKVAKYGAQIVELFKSALNEKAE